MKRNFTIHHYEFNSKIETELIQNHREFLSWPIVYFLNNNKSYEAYVGETTDVINRLNTHSKNEQKQKTTTVHLVSSPFFSAGVS